MRGRLGLVAFGLVLGGLLAVGLWFFTLRPARCEPAIETGEVLGALGMYREPCVTFNWDPRDPGYPEHVVRYNNHGMHDESVTYEKPDGVYRVLILGDSYPQGLQVPMEQGFPDLLETRLNRELNGRYEVVNFGIDTIGTGRSLLLYALLGYRFDADLILMVTYIGNDIQNNGIELEALRNEGYRPQPFFKVDAGGNLRLYNYPGDLPGGNSPTLAWARRVRVTRPYPIETPDAPAIISEDPYALEYPVQLDLYAPETEFWTEAWEVSGAVLATFVELAEGAGSEAGIVLIPDRRAVHSADYDATVEMYPRIAGFDADAPIERTRSQAEAAGAPYLDTTVELRALAADGTRAYLPLDGHLTPEGHATIAELLYEWLLATYALP